MSENIILKHKDLIKVCQKCPSIEEIDVLNSSLSGNQLYRQRIPEGVFVYFDLENWARNRVVSVKEAYRRVIEHLEEITSSTGKVAIGLSLKQVWHTNLISSYKVEESTYSIWIQWNTKALPMVSGAMVPGTFISVDKRMGALSNKKKYLMYELLQKHIYKVDFYIYIEEIYRECAIGDSEYKDFKDFQKRVLKPTLLEIENITGMSITCKKKFNKVVFNVEKKVVLNTNIELIDSEELNRLRKENDQLKEARRLQNEYD